jgi:hypothetical protein
MKPNSGKRPETPQAPRPALLTYLRDHRKRVTATIDEYDRLLELKRAELAALERQLGKAAGAAEYLDAMIRMEERGETIGSTAGGGAAESVDPSPRIGLAG